MFKSISFVFVAVAAVSASIVPRQSVSTPIGTTITGGFATYYNQFGGFGACGQQNPDSALIVALQTQRYASSLCGQSVTVTNLNNGRVVTASIADQCPGCANANSLDLSIGAWEAIGESTADGSEVPINWVLNN
ncbi:unnamed protein product [Peniophora sp. CBMAI 1063]|nr:unnamed protein product [Peniophora sp. CBMAI 1063]